MPFPCSGVAEHGNGIPALLSRVARPSKDVTFPGHHESLMVSRSLHFDSISFGRQIALVVCADFSGMLPPVHSEAVEKRSQDLAQIPLSS